MPVILNQPNSIGTVGFGPQEVLNGNGAVTQGFSNVHGSIPGHLLPLANSERVLIKQRKELLEVILGCETQNRYDVLDEQNQTIYAVEESSEFCMRCWCGPLRPIFVDIKDKDGNTVIHLSRPLACQEICFPCCLQSMAVQSPHGNPLGHIQQKWGLRPILEIRDETNQLVFVVKGPFCQFSCRCGDVEFPIYASDGISECGKISKRWRGVLHEAFTDADIFGVNFPPGINTQMKVLLIGATFLIDYMYFESSNQ